MGPRRSEYEHVRALMRMLDVDAMTAWGILRRELAELEIKEEGDDQALLAEREQRERLL